MMLCSSQLYTSISIVLFYLMDDYKKKYKENDKNNREIPNIKSSDETCMRMALDQAEKSLSAREVPVGCVIFRICGGYKIVIAEGHNKTNESCNATRHAEMVAIDSILMRQGTEYGPEIFSSCELFVTCEPCIMCASALSQIGIRRVVYGCSNAKFGGCGSILNLHFGGSYLLREKPKRETRRESSLDSPVVAYHPYLCRSGVLEEEAVALFRKFYSRLNINAPTPKRKYYEEDEAK
mmetsp:Transcript_6370/g.9675  ORF Transcript_6370/g.9675 Transcript_6370/m.9675 type:complete len:237 (+) Transcript_6370:17-727(+)